MLVPYTDSSISTQNTMEPPEQLITDIDNVNIEESNEWEETPTIGENSTFCWSPWLAQEPNNGNNTTHNPTHKLTPRIKYTATHFLSSSSCSSNKSRKSTRTIRRKLLKKTIKKLSFTSSDEQQEVIETSQTFNECDEVTEDNEKIEEHKQTEIKTIESIETLQARNEGEKMIQGSITMEKIILTESLDPKTSHQKITSYETQITETDQDQQYDVNTNTCEDSIPDNCNTTTQLSDTSESAHNNNTVEADQVQDYLDSTFWVRRVFGIMFSKYLEATGDKIGDQNVKSFSAEEKDKIEITVTNKEMVNIIVQTGLNIDNEWFKAYRLSERPVQVTLCGVPPFIPHSVLAEGLKAIVKCDPDDFEHMRAPADKTSLHHVLSHRRKVWIRVKQNDTIPEFLEITFGGKNFPIAIINGTNKCYGCGRTGHIRRNCRMGNIAPGNNNHNRDETVQQTNTENSTIRIAPITRDGIRATYSTVVKTTSTSTPYGNGKKTLGKSTKRDEAFFKQLGEGNTRIIAQLKDTKKYPPGTDNLTKTQTDAKGTRGYNIDRQDLSNKITQNIVNRQEQCTENFPSVSGYRQWENTSRVPLKKVLQKSETGGRFSCDEMNQVSLDNEEVVFKMTSTFLDASEEHVRKGSYPDTVMLNIDVCSWLQIIDSERAYFQTAGLLPGMLSFVKAAHKHQEMDTESKRTAIKRPATSSEELSGSSKNSGKRKTKRPTQEKKKI